MAKYRILVSETQTYEVYVEAKTQDEAIESAMKNYGHDGEVFHTEVELIDYEEEA
jgi:hypothetical protein